MTFQTIQSKKLFEGRIFSLRQDRVRLPDGSETNLDIIDHPGAVAMIPVDDEGQLWFIEQYRYAAGKSLVELPAGGLYPGEDPEKCALRELREEIGMGAKSFKSVGGFYLAPGYSNEYLHVFLATRLYEAPLPGDEDEFLSIKKLSIEETITRAHHGQFHDGKTLAALFLAFPTLSRLAGDL